MHAERDLSLGELCWIFSQQSPAIWRQGLGFVEEGSFLEQVRGQWGSGFRWIKTVCAFSICTYKLVLLTNHLKSDQMMNLLES